MTRVLLINMPFAAVESPSLALGLLKSGLAKEGIPCDVEYLNFTFARIVGVENYHFVVMSPALFAGERTFAHVLFGNNIPDDAQYYSFIGGITPADTPYRLQYMKTCVPTFLDYCLQSIPWHQYDIIGFSSLFEQNLPALALAHLVKQYYPNKKIIFGGPNVEGIMGVTLHRCFPWVDFVCSGEGDKTFPELVKRLKYGAPVNDVPGIVYRENGKSVFTGKAPLISDLDILPFPDYDDYFRALSSNRLNSIAPQYLLFETARGCWWGEKSQCMFCGLNGENLKFRGKSAGRIIDEIMYLTSRYHLHHLRATDNALNLHHFKDLLPELARLKLKTHFTFEVRANLKKNQVKMLKDANIDVVQVGVENLSTDILKLMNKGTTSLMNIQVMKWCKQYGVFSDWNIIFGFPGEKPEYYKRNLELANILTYLNPPTGFGPIRMDRNSPNYNCALELGFTNLRPMASYRYIYPFAEETLLDLVYCFDFDYREKINEGGYYIPLQQAVARWKSNRAELYACQREGQLVIYDSRPGAKAPQFAVTGVYRLIYEYCDQTRKLEQIEKWLNAHDKTSSPTDKDRIKVILDEFIAMDLMVQDNGQYLSLAVMTYPLESDTEG